MSTLASGRSRAEPDAVVAAATAGDASAFSELVTRHRHELQVHAYRMLGSYEDAEDLAQETLLRAWHWRESFRGDSSFRAWLFRIATNACLTALERRARRVPTDRASVVGRSEPHSDRALEELATTEAVPETDVVERETTEHAFLAAVQHLPPRQRAVLFLHVLGWSARETAELLETSVAAVRSSLQRARATLRRRLPQHPLEWTPAREPTEEERTLLQLSIDAAERGDASAFAAMVHEAPQLATGCAQARQTVQRTNDLQRAA
jgi:RNA polymerase sigma-70 factor (ECF subfamily)